MLVVMVHRYHNWVELLVASAFGNCMAPSGTIEATPQEGGFGSVLAPGFLKPVCGKHGVLGNS